MNKKEIREIRRRFNPDYDSISRIYGCYVNAAKQIVSRIDLSLGLMEKEEAEMYLKLLKKGISGTLGRNLIDIEFSTAQVENSDEHKLLQALRLTHLADENMRELFYTRVIENLNMGEDSYVILMASDAYDVPFKGSDDEVFDEGSSDVFNYFVCAICPVKDAKAALSYQADEKNFRGACIGHVLTAPEIGFMFPAFDDRSTNIYNLLYYSRNTADLHDAFIESVFGGELPMPAPQQQETFQNVLQEALEEECSLDVVQAVHETVRTMIEEQKADKTAEPLRLGKQEVKQMLEDCGVSMERAQAFEERYDQTFGAYAELPAVNLVTPKQFKVDTPSVSIRVDPERSDLIETRVIDGKNYILVLADGDVQVNGVNVKFNL